MYSVVQYQTEKYKEMFGAELKIVTLPLFHEILMEKCNFLPSIDIWSEAD